MSHEADGVSNKLDCSRPTSLGLPHVDCVGTVCRSPDEGSTWDIHPYLAHSKQYASIATTRRRVGWNAINVMDRTKISKARPNIVCTLQLRYVHRLPLQDTPNNRTAVADDTRRRKRLRQVLLRQRYIATRRIRSRPLVCAESSMKRTTLVTRGGVYLRVGRRNNRFLIAHIALLQGLHIMF